MRRRPRVAFLKYQDRCHPVRKFSTFYFKIPKVIKFCILRNKNIIYEGILRFRYIVLFLILVRGDASRMRFKHFTRKLEKNQ